MLTRLTNTLNEIAKPFSLYECPDGGRVLILPYGGRILGLFPPGSDENFLWTHPALDSADSAKAFYNGPDWHNSGGDRTWLAPEVDLFFPDFPDTKKYWQQRTLDPGNYRLDRVNEYPRVTNRLACTFSRSRQTVDMEITKTVAPAANPLLAESASSPSDVAYAGYTLHTGLHILTPDTPVHVGLWNLLQMPHGGDLLVPTYARTLPKIYFGSIPPDDLLVSDRLVRYRMRASGEHKIGLRAVATAGRVGYLYPAGSQYALIVRNFFVNPSGPYVDVPWTDTADLGYSTQACNIHSGLGSFSELEYHVPAVGGGTGRLRSDDVSQVWAFRGPEDSILSIARRFVSPDA